MTENDAGLPYISANPAPPTVTADVSALAIQPALNKILEKRRSPIRHPPATKTSNAHAPTHTIKFFSLNFIYTENDWLSRAMIRKFPEMIAVMLMGMELEPRHQVRFQLGALSLGLYAITEALTQSIVLAVLHQLTYLATRNFLFLGLGEVVVNAGVRVLFAAGIQLQGLRDMNEELDRLLIG